MPIIADERVEPEFGTGAVKITPGHDPMDWEIGRDHELSGADGDRPRRADVGGGRRARRPDAGRGREADPGAARGARADREARAVPALGRSLQPVSGPDRAARPPPVVGGDGGAREAGDRCRPRGPRALASRAADEGDALVPREHPPLVHLAPALVGAPDPGLVLPRRAHDGRRDRAGGVRASAARRS